MVEIKTEWQRKRTEQALAETIRLLAREEAYQPHLQNAEYVAFLRGHIATLTTALERAA